jgi:hypothetical protein
MKYAPGFILLLGSWLQPLHVLPWVSWHSELLAFAALAWFTGQLIWEMLSEREGHWAIPLAACLPMALALYVMLQFGVGQIDFFGDALMIAFYLTACSVAITVGYQWKNKPNDAGSSLQADGLLDQLAVTVLIGALVSVCIMLVQAFDVWNSIDWIARAGGYRRPGGNTGQANHMATIILMGMVSLAWLYETTRLGGVLTWLLQLLLVLGMAMTESRTVLVSAIVLTAWWLAKRGLFAKMRAIPPVAVIWGGLVLLVWLWPVFIVAWHDMGVSASSRITAGAGMRSVVWAQLLDAAAQRPWAGWGMREISEAHNAVLHRYQESAPFSYAHNVILDLVIGVGFPLAVLLVVLCTLWLWNRARKSQTLTTWYGVALGIPLIVHSMLEFPYAYAYFLIPVLLAVGRMEALAGQGAVLTIRTGHAGLAAGLLSVLMIWTAVEYVRIEEDFRIARFEALGIGHTPEHHTAPELILLTQLDVMLTATRTKPALGMDASDIEMLRRAAMRFPWTAIQNRYALSLALNGNEDEAVRQLQVLRAMHGEKHYGDIRISWKLLGEEKFPQLLLLPMP